MKGQEQKIAEKILDNHFPDGLYGMKAKVLLAMEEYRSLSLHAVESKSEGWIACSERLPERGARVLTFDGHTIDFSRYSHSTKYGNIFGRFGSGQTYNVTHWQTLPKAPLTLYE